MKHYSKMFIPVLRSSTSYEYCMCPIPAKSQVNKQTTNSAEEGGGGMVSNFLFRNYLIDFNVCLWQIVEKKNFNVKARRYYIINVVNYFVSFHWYSFIILLVESMPHFQSKQIITFFL